MNRLVINADLGRQTISRHIYGHFAEHLGRCIYDGVWVGEESPIPNTRGIRNDVVQALRAINIPNLRWPGGCYADAYHWRDGIGPKEQRPRTINFHWGNVVEDNSFGIHEFMDLCDQLGCEPYICGNVGSGSPREMAEWVEYLTFDGDSTLASLRRANGRAEPWKVTFWGIGNENWGCGGSFSPEDYCMEFRRYASFVRPFGGTKLTLIACGPAHNDVEWTIRFFRKLRKDFWDFNNIHGFAAHYYCGTAGTATQYTTDQWYQLIGRGLEMEPLIVQQRAALDAYDPQRRIGLIVDEWGTWHPVEPGTNPAFLYQQNTLRDALVAATTLDIFNRHADKVVMSNIAQTINVLQAMILTEGERMLVTPTGHVYEMYAPHQDGLSVATTLETDGVSYRAGDKDATIPAVAASASVKGSRLFLTVTNCHAEQAATVAVQLRRGSATGATARTLTGEIHSHNTFDRPAALEPEPLDVAAHGASFNLELPPASVSALSIELE